MLRYDAITDKEISSKLSDLVATDSTQILGGLLEVTPKLAQKANVEYQNHGSFTTANHIFLSGYERSDRLKIIDTYMDAFFNRFGNYPPVIGVDSLDSFSFDYLVSHYSVIAAFIQDETYQSNNLRHWGGILAEPYLPSKTNILLPAQDSKNKINGVVFRWSPADPFDFFSKNSISRFDPTHINIRLDNNYQLFFQTEDSLKNTEIAKQFATNFVKQLKDKQDNYSLTLRSTTSLGELIKARYPETSPASFFIANNVYWYQNPFYRLVLRQTNNGDAEIIDFHVYNPKITGEYFHQKNIQTVSFQEIQGIIDSVKFPESSLFIDINLETAKITSEYWDLIITDGQKVFRAEPKKIIFENFSPPSLESNQIKIKTSRNSTQWLINPTPPFKNLFNSNYFVIKLALIFLFIFLILKTTSSFLRRQESILFLGLLFGFITLIPVLFSGQVYSFGLGLWGPNGHDAIFHLSLINSLKDNLLSLSHPQISGQVLQNYHLGVDWVLALISKLTGLQPAILLLRYLPIVLLAVIVSQLIKLLSSWKFSKPAIHLSLFLSFLAGSFGFVFTLLKSGNLFAGESLFWMNQSVSIFLNPPFAFSIALLLIFLNLYTANGKFILLILIGGLLAQVKIYAFILLLLSLLILREIKLFIGIGLVGLLLSLPTLGLQGSPFVFSPLWFPKSLIAAQDKLNWQKLAQAWQVYEANGVYIKLFIVNSLALIIYLLGNLGVRVIGLLNILKKDFSSESGALSDCSDVESFRLVKSIILLGLIIPLLFIQANNPWNTIQFSYYSLFFLSIFTAQAISSKKRSLITWILVFGLTLPTTIGTLRDYITPYSASKISFTELQALETLKSQEKGIVISPIFSKSKSRQFPAPKPLYAYTTTAYISAISGQPEYLSDLINLDITGFDYKERVKNVQRFYQTQDPTWVKNFLQTENIKYIYTTPISQLQINPQKTCLTPIFDTGEIIIYKFNCYD